MAIDISNLSVSNTVGNYPSTTSIITSPTEFGGQTGWTTQSGRLIATLQERITISLPLPIQNFSGTVKLISGTLPPGVRLENTNLVGTPLEVARDTDFQFVLRAQNGDEISDRTFIIKVIGPDSPLWVTPEDLLAIGNNETFFIIDNQPVNFQLTAIDNDTSAGQVLDYFIGSGDGSLPPGLTLTSDGRIVGIVDPILAITKETGSGEYDTSAYDADQAAGFDFGIRSSNGFESFFYDTTTYDLAIPTRSPKKLNRYYEFTVSVSDGDTVSRRTFRIYVVGDDYLRSDNTIMQIGTGIFRADNSHIRVPIWLTPADLGYKRANNYVTIQLDIIDSNTLSGVVVYTLESGALPPGLQLDSTTGEIAGYVPYQPAVTKPYSFTIKAVRATSGEGELAESSKTFTVKILGEIDSTISWKTPADLGTINSNYISTLSVKANTTVPNAVLLYSLESGTLPPGLSLKFDGEIVGKINNFGSATNPGMTIFDNAKLKFDNNTTTIDRQYKFTIKAKDQFGFSAIEQEFKIAVSDPDDKLYSNLYMKPFLKNTLRTKYRDFINNAEIFPSDSIYRPNDKNFGLQTEIKMLAYAGIESRDIAEYTTASTKNHKRKTFRFGELKTAVAKTPGTNDVVYEVVYLEVLDPYKNSKGVARKTVDIRSKNKITADIQLQTPNGAEAAYDLSVLEIYGRSKILKNKFHAGVVVHGRSGLYKYNITNVIEVGTRTQNVEIPFEKGTIESRQFDPTYPTTLKIDSDVITIDSATDNKRYISSIDHMRDAIKELGETEKNFLPLWMRTPQGNTPKELGYILAVPLVFCKPGTASSIKNSIEFNKFNFKDFQLDIDRYVIDSTTGDSNEQYIVFGNQRYNV